jgi:WD40 repeat protein
MLRRLLKHNALPAAEAPTGVVPLAGHGKNKWVRRIVPLSGGERVATASSDGKLRVFAVATGALEHELDAHERDFWQRALASLGGDIIVSGGHDDGRVVTWNAASGKRLGEAAAGSGVVALAAIDNRQFVAGTGGGDIVFYTHHGGRGVEEAARIARAHCHRVQDFALCGERLATVSHDKTAAVWGIDSREQVARLRGHTRSVWSVDVNDRLVVTASDDKTVRVYIAERNYSCTAALDWLHTDCIVSVWLLSATTTSCRLRMIIPCVSRSSRPALSSRAQS